MRGTTYSTNILLIMNTCSNKDTAAVERRTAEVVHPLRIIGATINQFETTNSAENSGDILVVSAACYEYQTN